MERVFQWLAIAMAAGIAAVGLFEINQRSEEAPPQAIEPTILPSPTAGATGGPIALPTVSVAEPTSAPPPRATTRVVVVTPRSTVAQPATPEPTVEPPPTPTPAPPTAIPPSPTVPPPGTRPTPKTGGGALGAGVTLAALALALRVALRRAY